MHSTTVKITCKTTIYEVFIKVSQQQLLILQNITMRLLIQRNWSNQDSTKMFSLVSPQI